MSTEDTQNLGVWFVGFLLGNHHVAYLVTGVLTVEGLSRLLRSYKSPLVGSCQLYGGLDFLAKDSFSQDDIGQLLRDNQVRGWWLTS
jgi:hypothetical protein